MQLTPDELAWSLRYWKRHRYSVDAAGHEHEGAGKPTGGQFTGKAEHGQSPDQMASSLGGKGAKKEKVAIPSSPEELLGMLSQPLTAKQLQKMTGDKKGEKIADLLKPLLQSGQVEYGVTRGNVWYKAKQGGQTAPQTPASQPSPQQPTQQKTQAPQQQSSSSPPSPDQLAERIRSEGGLHLGELMREFPNVPMEAMHDAIMQTWAQNRDEFDLEAMSQKSDEWTPEEWHKTLPRMDSDSFDGFGSPLGHIVSRKATPEQRQAVFGKRGKYVPNPNKTGGQNAVVFVPHEPRR